mmetsp:Transcript_60763/g.171920  ORF Transcript_60763/g.171920 Transcript_60763/m.171920 type:complete len:144 (-) Transcript_60763:21-452(-)
MTCPPPWSIKRSSNSEKAKLVGACTVATTVQPSPAKTFIKTQTSFAMAESKPEVGSSRKHAFGCVMSAKAILTRLACPPEMPRSRALPMTVERHLSSRNLKMTSSTRFFFSALLMDSGNLSSAVYINICSTESSPTRVSNCST